MGNHCAFERFAILHRDITLLFFRYYALIYRLAGCCATWADW